MIIGIVAQGASIQSGPPAPSGLSIGSFSSAGSSGLTDGITVSSPAGLEVGDTLLAFGYGFVNSRPFDPPAGWTEEFENIAAPSYTGLFKLEVTAVESSYYFTRLGAGNIWAIVLVVVKGGFSSIVSGTIGTAGTGASAIAPSIVVPSGDSLLFCIYMDEGAPKTLATAPAGIPFLTVGSSSNGNIAVCGAEGFVSGSTGDKTATWSATPSSRSSMLIAIVP